MGWAVVDGCVPRWRSQSRIYWDTGIRNIHGQAKKAAVTANLQRQTMRQQAKAPHTRAHAAAAANTIRSANPGHTEGRRKKYALAHAHAHEDTYTRTHAHARTCKRAPTHSYTHKHANAHAYVHAQAARQAHARTHAHTLHKHALVEDDTEALPQDCTNGSGGGAVEQPPLAAGDAGGVENRPEGPVHALPRQARNPLDLKTARVGCCLAGVQVQRAHCESVRDCDSAHIWRVPSSCAALGARARVGTIQS